MNPDLQSMSDWLRVNLLGVQVEWERHDWFVNGLDTHERLYVVCTRCGQKKYGNPSAKCHPSLPLLSAPEQYWRVIEAMQTKGYGITLEQFPDAPCFAFFRLRGALSWRQQEGATIGESIIRAAFAALGGE